MYCLENEIQSVQNIFIELDTKRFFLQIPGRSTMELLFDSFLQILSTRYVSHPASYQMGKVQKFQGSKKLEEDNSYSYTFEVKNAWSYYPIPTTSL